MNAKANDVTVHIAADVAEFDEWLRSLRLLISQVGAALDGYLATRPPPDEQD